MGKKKNKPHFLNSHNMWAPLQVLHHISLLLSQVPWAWVSSRGVWAAGQVQVWVKIGRPALCNETGIFPVWTLPTKLSCTFNHQLHHSKDLHERIPWWSSHQDSELSLPRVQVQSLVKEQRLPWWISGKKSACNEGDARDSGLTLVGKTSPPGEGNGNPLQYSCLENAMDRGAWRATVIGSPRARHDWACTCKELRPTEIPQTAALGQKKIIHVEARETAPLTNAINSAWRVGCGTRQEIGWGLRKETWFSSPLCNFLPQRWLRKWLCFSECGYFFSVMWEVMCEGT